MPVNATQMPPSRLPVTSHHLFPAALMLWFGALFGLSSLAVRTALFEQLVLSIHLDAILPMAAPPLGHVARLLLALGFAVLGAGIGLIVARLVALMGAQAIGPEAPEPPPPPQDIFRVRARDAHPDAPARRPVSARDELAQVAPIPRSKPAASMADRAEERIAWPRPRHEHAEADTATAESPQNGSIEPEPVAAEPAPGPVEVAPPAPPVTAAERIAKAHPSQLSPVELIERLAIAMQRRSMRQGSDTAPRDPAQPQRDERIAAIESLRDTLATLRAGTG